MLLCLGLGFAPAGAADYPTRAIKMVVPFAPGGGTAVGWFGLLAPAHTPKEIVDKLNAAVVAIMGTQDFKDKLAAHAAEPQPQTPDEFARYINADVAKWTALVREQNITIPGAGK